MKLHSKSDAIFKHSSIGIIVTDKEGIILDINPAAEAIFGYEPGELVGKVIESLVQSQIKDKHIEYRDSYMMNPTPRSMGINRDLRAVKKDGSQFPVEVGLCSYDIDGELNIVSFVNDITERKKNESELSQFAENLEVQVNKRTKELSEALIELNHTNNSLKESEQKVIEALASEKNLNEMKSRFVSMASHEFRTPLAGILTSVSLIEKYKELERPDKMDKHITSIKRSVRNLTNILGDFLSLDKLEGGEIKANKSFFNPLELIEQIVEDMKDMAQAGQQIHLNSKGGDKNIFQDKEMLRNILLNLLNNAIKYSGESALIEVSFDLGEEQLVMSIKDNGMGIPKEDQHHLFKRFFRAKNALNLDGTGLGLNIVNNYIKLMNGSIEFVSAQDMGTTFTITLPVGEI